MLRVIDDDPVTQLALAAGRGDRRALDQFIRATERDVWRLVAVLADPGSAGQDAGSRGDMPWPRTAA